MKKCTTLLQGIPAARYRSLLQGPGAALYAVVDDPPELWKLQPSGAGGGIAGGADGGADAAAQADSATAPASASGGYTGNSDEAADSPAAAAAADSGGGSEESPSSSASTTALPMSQLFVAVACFACSGLLLLANV